MITLIISILIMQLKSFAQETLPISTQNLQLQQLIEKSEQQIKELKDILSYKKQDAASLENASKILEKMSAGIDKSIEKYKGTEIFDKALLDLQSKDDFKKTYAESKEIRDLVHDPTMRASQKNFDDSVKFQKESVRANQSDIVDQKQLQQDLKSAQPGFVPKLQAQAELGNWRASTRMSAQMTELLASIHTMREELRALRLKEEKSDVLNMLITGSEIQNQKLRETNHK